MNGNNEIVFSEFYLNFVVLNMERDANIIYTASSVGLSTVSLFPSFFTRYLN